MAVVVTVPCLLLPLYHDLRCAALKVEDLFVVVSLEESAETKLCSGLLAGTSGFKHGRLAASIATAGSAIVQNEQSPRFPGDVRYRVL